MRAIAPRVNPGFAYRLVHAPGVERHRARGQIVVLDAIEAGSFHQRLQFLLIGMDADGFGEIAVARGVVGEDALIKRLPQTKRTWLRFRGGAYSGANLFLLGGPKIRSTLELWRSNEQNRKKAWRMLLTVGLFAGVGALLRLRTLQQTLDTVGRKLNLRIRVVELSDPLAAVDVDKPADHELVTAILEGRA